MGPNGKEEEFRREGPDQGCQQVCGQGRIGYREGRHHEAEEGFREFDRVEKLEEVRRCRSRRQFREVQHQEVSRVPGAVFRCACRVSLLPRGPEVREAADPQRVRQTHQVISG